MVAEKLAKGLLHLCIKTMYVHNINNKKLDVKKKHKITVSVFYQILVHFLSKGKGCRHISISSLLSRSCQEQRPHHFFYVFGFSSRFHVSSIGFGLVSSDLIGRFDWVQSRHRSRCQGCAPWCTVSLRVDGKILFESLFVPSFTA